MLKAHVIHAWDENEQSVPFRKASPTARERRYLKKKVSVFKVY
jgi:hypothetical protein